MTALNTCSTSISETIYNIIALLKIAYFSGKETK